jgi:hypothetical protein
MTKIRSIFHGSIADFHDEVVATRFREIRNNSAPGRVQPSLGFRNAAEGAKRQIP